MQIQKSCIQGRLNTFMQVQRTCMQVRLKTVQKNMYEICGLNPLNKQKTFTQCCTNVRFTHSFEVYFISRDS